MALKDLISGISRTYGNAVFPFCNFKQYLVIHIEQRLYHMDYVIEVNTCCLQYEPLYASKYTSCAMVVTLSVPTNRQKY